MDSLQVMKSVVAVAESRSFTSAAERLRTTPQMVSKHVKALESRLGVRLFDRTTRTVRVTEVGEAVVAQGQGILEAMEALEASVQDVQRSPRGRLRVAAPLTFGEMYVAPHLAAFRARYPGVEVTVVLTDRYVNLVEEGIDVAVRVGILEDSSLVGRRLTETELICVGAPSYLEARGAPETPKSLGNHDLIHDDRGALGTRLASSEAQPTWGPQRGRSSVAQRRSRPNLPYPRKGEWPPTPEEEPGPTPYPRHGEWPPTPETKRGTTPQRRASPET